MAEYFQNTEHLSNRLKKALREHGREVNPDKLLPVDVYVDVLTREGLATTFSQSLWEDITLFEEDLFWRWIKNHKEAKTFPAVRFKYAARYKYILTPRFQSMIDNLAMDAGVYSFWENKDTPLYVGMSIRLGNRILSSYVEHSQGYNQKIWIRVIITKTASDATVLEMALIAIMKPPQNRAGKHKDELTLLMQLPKWSKPVLCSTLEERTDYAKEW